MCSKQHIVLIWKRLYSPREADHFYDEFQRVRSMLEAQSIVVPVMALYSSRVFAGRLWESRLDSFLRALIADGIRCQFHRQEGCSEAAKEAEAQEARHRIQRAKWLWMG